MIVLSQEATSEPVDVVRPASGSIEDGLRPPATEQVVPAEVSPSLWVRIRAHPLAAMAAAVGLALLPISLTPLVEDGYARSRDRAVIEEQRRIDDDRFVKAERNQRYSALNDALTTYISTLDDCKKVCPDERFRSDKALLDKALAAVRAYGSKEAVRIAARAETVLGTRPRSSGPVRAIREDLQQRIYAEITG